MTVGSGLLSELLLEGNVTVGSNLLSEVLLKGKEGKVVEGTIVVPGC